MTMTEPVVAEVSEPVATTPARPFGRIVHHKHIYLVALLLLTFVGGAMRFSFLEKPCIWFDEAATYARTSARYVELLEALEEAGFGPLHYHAIWWIKNGLPLWGHFE